MRCDTNSISRSQCAPPCLSNNSSSSSSISSSGTIRRISRHSEEQRRKAYHSLTDSPTDSLTHSLTHGLGLLEHVEVVEELGRVESQTESQEPLELSSRLVGKQQQQRQGYR
eukprot:GHVU01114386.1.p1 GENE.GHVU01114386.1~~GHVU01114386.1.p1  ORF type:complete len:112 (-),score=15.41 GHVU01114386.1:99-434(-)